MREIKFRAWSYIAGYNLVANVPEGTGSHWEGKWVMCEVSTIHIKNNGCRLRYPVGNSYEATNCAIGDKCEIMQFTGLQDKNGKDIYEGDIIPSNNNKGNHPVIFENGTFMWFGEPLGYDMGADQEDAVYPQSNWAIIIGNIYENPELLK